MAEKPMLGGCCVCLDERGWAENPLVYCDGQACSVAVHQACYGIVKVPSGPWFCRKCESQERAAKVKCELCPHRDGALKRTDSSGWAHVVCALYIPEVTFGSVSTMEPIILQKVPADRFNKTCYICEEENRSSKAVAGACMTCAKQMCKASFHVTCAQMAGLLCEEASSGNQTKYCGYCKAHLAKGKKTSSAYKNLSSTKVYKLPITSSSDELTSPERSQPCLPEPSVMKPGDIRYTKAGKKRSKSLEESLASGTTEDKNASSKESADTSSSDAKKPDLAPTKHQSANSSSARESEQNVSTETNKSVDDTLSEVDVEKNKLDPEESSKPIAGSASSSIPLQTIATENSCPEPESTGGNCTGLTLSSLAEAASVVSQSSTEPGEEPPSYAQETAAKKLKSSSKDPSLKKKHRENKKSKVKKSEQEKKRRKTPLSGIMPHRPVPPPITSRDPATAAGTAVYPRHSVVSLAKMGLDRTETYEAHEIGDNNKVFKPDFSVDGVTALEQIQMEQKQDTSDFFLQYGTTPEVSALMEALRKVKEDNSRIESAIQQMARRRDQLLLIKTRLMGLQMRNVSVATSASAQHSNVGQHQINSQVLPSQSVPAPQMSSSPHLPAASQHPQP